MTNQERFEKEKQELKEIFERMDKKLDHAYKTNDWSDVFISGKKEYPNNKESEEKETSRIVKLLETLRDDAKKMLNKEK